MFGAKIEIAALEKAIAFELVMVPFDPERGYDPRHPDVLRINPKRQVPVLIDGDLELFDSTQIFEYLEDLKPEPALWPKQPARRALARQLEHRSDEIYFSHIIRLMGLEKTPDDPAHSPPETRRRNSIARWNRLYRIVRTWRAIIPLPISHFTWRSFSAPARERP